MVKPRRVKVEGDLFHPRVPPGAEYVGRAAPYLKASPYANPYLVKAYGLEQALQLYRGWLTPDLIESARRDLRGRDLACRCELPAEGEPDLCHAAILLALINQP